MRIYILAVIIKLIMGKKQKSGRIDSITNKVNWG